MEGVFLFTDGRGGGARVGVRITRFLREISGASLFLGGRGGVRFLRRISGVSFFLGEIIRRAGDIFKGLVGSEGSTIANNSSNLACAFFFFFFLVTSFSGTPYSLILPPPNVL